MGEQLEDSQAFLTEGFNRDAAMMDLIKTAPRLFTMQLHTDSPRLE